MDTKTVIPSTGPSPLVGLPRRLILVGLAVGILVVFLGTTIGIWPMPLLASLVWAVIVPSTTWQYVGALIMSVIGYAIPLLIAAISLPIGQAASVIAAIMGFSHAGILVFLFTFVLAASMGIAGAWVGHAIRLLARSRGDRHQAARHE